MKNYRVFILYLLLIAFTFVACINSKVMNKPPELSVTTGDKKIGYVVGLNRWNDVSYNSENPFHTIMKKDSGIEVPYIKLGEAFQINFKGNAPDSFELKDYLLKENGDAKYTGKEVKKIPVSLTVGKGTFKLEPNGAELLSSDSRDYEPGKTIRGFKLICRFGNNECEYGFIIRTDAKR